MPNQNLVFMSGFGNVAIAAEMGIEMAMQGLETGIFSSVVSDIYDCALNPHGWNTVLTRVSTLMNAAYATISLADMPHINPVMAAHSPWDPEMLRILNEDFGAEGVPGLREVIFGDLDVPQSTMNQMSEEEFQQSRFYLEWVKPQRLRDACVVKFAQTGSRLGVIGVITYAERDIVTTEERRFMQLISPHFRRAALIGDLLNQQRVTTDLYKQTLASMGTPVMLTDRTGRLLFANPKAEELIASGQEVRSVKGVVTGSSVVGAGALADAIARASAGELSLGGRGIGIPLSERSTNPVVAYVLPLTSGTLRGAYENAAVAIFIASGAGAALPAEALLITLFDLTPMEARVMTSLGKGKPRLEASSTMGMSENTVKTHLARIFAKTGTSRQSDLVRLLNEVRQP
jgi:DNA-binding CsgD family transcriptional regulator/PAS domain-containing protein